MSEALRCDGPDCVKVTDGLALAWLHLQPASHGVMLLGQLEDAHFCSWECLGAYVMEHSELAQAFEQRIRGD